MINPDKWLHEKGGEKMLIKDKYRMTKEQNIFYAKRNIIDSIWKEANLEGLNVTFPDTQAIYEGVNVPAMQV